MKKKQERLVNIEWIYDFWKEEVNNLEKKDIILKIADFDYTLFCRNEQLENEKWLKENRWDAGPEYIFKNIWMSNFLDKYYKNRTIPKKIISEMNTNYDIIISAWQYEFQIAKINIIKELNGFKKIITKNWEDKILTLIRYIIFELKFIPNKVIIYEDRPKYFIENKDLIENVLWCELEIMFVEMNGNNTEPKITKINKKID